MTRRDVAEALGVGISTVRRLEQSGRLTPTIGEGLVRHFDETQVEALRRERGVTNRAQAPADHERDPKGQALQSTTVPTVRGEGLPREPLASDVAARVFAALRDGQQPVDIVITQQIHPRVVEQCVELYSRLDLAAGRVPDVRRRLAALEESDAQIVYALDALRDQLAGVAVLLQQAPELVQVLNTAWGACHELSALVREARAAQLVASLAPFSTT